MSDPQNPRGEPNEREQTDDQGDETKPMRVTRPAPGEGQPPTAPDVAPPVTSMPDGSGSKPSAAPQRGTVRSIHYTLSFVVRNAERGPRGAIVLLHDLPGGAFVWQDILPQFDGTGRAVYAFDLLGYGQSDRPWPSDTSVWGHGDNLGYAFQALGLSEIVLVGFGVGGGVAQVLATRTYRPAVAKLVLSNSYGYTYAFAPNWPLPEMTKRQDPDAPKHTQPDQVVADLRATVPQGAANPRYLAGSKLDAYVNEWNSHVGKELLFQHIRQMIPSYINSVSSYLKTLETPTLLVWGEQDAVAPVGLTGERMAREMPAARLEVVQGAGHLILDDAPNVVGRLISDFAGRLGVSSFAMARKH
jgi:pimeloyl-ACP methyl ester carboxylesterase